MQFDHGHTHRDQVSRLSALGQDALRSGDLAGARQHFCDVVRIEPENGPAWRQLAAIAETPEERVALLEQVTRLEPSNDAALASLAEAKQELDLLRRARRQQDAPAQVRVAPGKQLPARRLDARRRPLDQRAPLIDIGERVVEARRQDHLHAPRLVRVIVRGGEIVRGRGEHVAEIGPDIAPPVAVMVDGVGEIGGRDELGLPHGARP